MKYRLFLPLVLSFCIMLTASAQTMKPGLWEINSKMSSSSGELEKAMAEMQKQLAAMPPEQRKKMQEMMGKQGVGMGDSLGSAIKMCLTKEMVESNQIPAQSGNCKHTNSPRNGKTMKMTFTCTNPPSSGEGETTFNSGESYTSTMRMNATSAQGKPETMVINSSGKWLATDCGAIKPVGQRTK